MVVLKIDEHINYAKGWKYQDVKFDIDKNLKQQYQNRVVELYFNNIPVNEAIKQAKKELEVDNQDINKWLENIITNLKHNMF